MKPDARITDIVESLADAENYVRGIVGSSIEHGFDKQRSQIRIGVSGKGVFPNYSIVEPCEPEERVIEGQGVSLKITSSVGKRMVFHGQRVIEKFWKTPLGATLGALMEIEALVGCRLCEKFNLIYGTSTGAIITALLAPGKPLDEIESLYRLRVVSVMGEVLPSKKTAALEKSRGKYSGS